MRLRSWTLIALLLTMACGRTGLGTAQQAPADTHNPGVVDARELPQGVGSIPDALSGPCGDAACLSSLFQTCVPTGACRAQGTGSPSAVVSNTCYANGVRVSYMGGWNGTNVTTTLSVSRRGEPCYTIKSTSGTAASATTYVISGPDGEVATAVTADKAGAISVTCQGHEPVLADSECLRPVTTSPDCNLETCP